MQHPMKKRALLLLLALPLLPACTSRQAGAPSEPAARDMLKPEEAKALSDAYLQSGAALMQGDAAQVLASLMRAFELNPGDDSLVYEIASAFAQTEQPEQALLWLERLVGLRSPLVPQDRDFPGLQGERYQRVVEALQRNTPPSRGTVAFTLPERDLIPEGIAHDAVTGTFFVGSILKRKVVAIRPDGTPTDFATAEAHGLDAVLGMRVDPQRRILWVNSAAMPSMQGFNEALRGRSTLHKFDLTTGRLLARYTRGPGGRHLLNDMALGPEGELFLTDSEAGEVLKLPAHAPEGTAFEVLVPAGNLFYPNGITLSEDGSTLFIADFVHGITVLRRGSGERLPLLHPRGTTTRGVDGLYFHQGSLVAVQNGYGPGRIVRMRLADSKDRILRTEVLEANHPSFRIPTTAVIAGEALYLIANSQLRSMGADGRYLPPEQLEPVVLLRIPL
jgi:hypothetical protein